MMVVVVVTMLLLLALIQSYEVVVVLMKRIVRSEANRSHCLGVLEFFDLPLSCGEVEHRLFVSFLKLL